MFYKYFSDKTQEEALALWGARYEYWNKHKAAVITFRSNVPGYEMPIALFSRPSQGITAEHIVEQFVLVANQIAETAGDLYLADVAKPTMDLLSQKIEEFQRVGMAHFALKLTRIRQKIHDFAYQIPITFFNLG